MNTSSNDIPDYAFKVAYTNVGIPRATEVTQSEIEVVSTENDVAPRYGTQMTRISVGPDTSKELVGTKINQRSELNETSQSDDGNTQSAETWYGFSLFIDPSSLRPSDFDDAPTTRITLFQFHQRTETGSSDRPAIMVQWTPDGDVIASFETAIGKRTYTLVDGGADGAEAKGKWIDFKFGMDWSITDAWTKIYTREGDEEDYVLKVNDEQPNTSTGSIYTKFGVYRSFLERDPALEASTTTVYYDGVRRATSEAEIDAPLREGNSYGTDYDDTLASSKDGGLHYGLGGDDLFLAGKGADKFDGGSDNDTVSYQSLTGYVRADLSNSLEGKGKARGDSFTSIENLVGNEQRNLFLGDDADNTFIGNGGNDRLEGNGGSDILDGGNGNDRLLGGIGDDLLIGGKGKDCLEGGTDDDILVGGADRDRLDGGTGNDVLIGGAGVDQLIGGAGTDTFVFLSDEADGSRDRILDFNNNGSEHDRIDLSDLALLSNGQTFEEWVDFHVIARNSGVKITLDQGSLFVKDHLNLGELFEASVVDALIL